MALRQVYGTHVTVCDSYVGHIDAIWPTEAEAREHAHAEQVSDGAPLFTLGEPAPSLRGVVSPREG